MMDGGSRTSLASARVTRLSNGLRKCSVSHEGMVKGRKTSCPQCRSYHSWGGGGINAPAQFKQKMLRPRRLHCTWFVSKGREVQRHTCPFSYLISMEKVIPIVPPKLCDCAVSPSSVQLTAQLKQNLMMKHDVIKECQSMPHPATQQAKEHWCTQAHMSRGSNAGHIQMAWRQTPPLTWRVESSPLGKHIDAIKHHRY